jgi:hypothetical protein
MSDSGEKPAEQPRTCSASPKRPNAKYNLSKKDCGGDEPQFYYNRERRLAKAPQPVRDLYADTKPKRFNLLRPLVGSKPRALLFFSILILCASILALSAFGYFDNGYALEGNKLSVKAARYEGSVIVTLKKTLQKNASASYAGAVDVAVSPAVSPDAPGVEVPPVFYHRVFFSLAPEEDYRFAVPFDAAGLVMVLQTEKNEVRFRIKAE